MITWKYTKDEHPSDRQSCFITQESTGFETYPILGPICYDKESGGFIDLFSSPEAGSIYLLEKMDIWWCDEKDINLPDSNMEAVDV